MPKTQTKNPHPIIKILSDLNLLPEKGEDVDAKSYKRAVRTAIVTIESSSKDKAGDSRSRMLRDELKRIKELEREKKEVEPPKQEVNIKEKKTTIKPAKFLPGTATTKPDDLKQAQIDESGEDKSKLLQPDILNDIAKSVESIATLLKRQLGVEKKQQRDAKIKQDKDNKAAREDKIETKPDKKTGGLPKAITKPALGFFERIKKFFLNIVIGAAALKLFNWLKDPANTEKIEKFSNFLINNAGWILGGLAAIALLPVLSSIMGVLGALKGGLLLLKPALALLFSPAGLAALALAAGLGGTLLAMKFLIDRGRDLATGGKTFTAKHESLDQRLKEAGMDSSGRIGHINRRGRFIKTGERNEEQEALFQEVLAERKRVNTLRDAMRNEIKYRIAIEPHDVPARKQGRQRYPSRLSNKRKGEVKKEVKAKYHNMIESGGVAPKEFLTKESTNLLIEKHKKTGETFSLSEDKTISNEKSSAVIDKDVKPNTDVPGPSTKKNGGDVVVAGGGGGNQQQSSGGGGGGGSSSVPKISSEDSNNLSTLATSTTYNMVGA